MNGGFGVGQMGKGMQHNLLAVVFSGHPFEVVAQLFFAAAQVPGFIILLYMDIGYNASSKAARDGRFVCCFMIFIADGITEMIGVETQYFHELNLSLFFYNALHNFIIIAAYLSKNLHADAVLQLRKMCVVGPRYIGLPVLLFVNSYAAGQHGLIVAVFIRL